MASVILEGKSESSSADEPIEHEDQVIETKPQVNCGPNFASFHDQLKKTQKDFEDLKTAVISSITLFENNIAKLKAKEERLVKLSCKIPSITFENTIKLNVGGHIYQTSLETLTKYPGSLLADMFSACFDLKQATDGCYFIDRDGTHFRHIVNYLRSGKAPVLSVLTTDAEEIVEEAEHYGLLGLVKAINNKLNGDDDNGRENIKEDDEIAINSMVDETRKELCATEEKLKSFLNLLDANLKVLDEATNHHNEVSKKLSNVHFGENVKIDVGGRIFKTSLKTLRKESESVLASMFSEKFELKKEDDGSFFIDRDGTFFHHILDYLRDGKISEGILDDCCSQMQKEAEFYGLSNLNEQIHNYNHVKLHVGGRDFVVTRDVLRQYPESMFGRMLSGKACAFKKREDGSFCVDHDGTNFHHILEYLRYGTISDDVIQECGVSLHDDAKFYMLPSLEKQIENYNNVKIDVGGREFVISRKVLTKFADSMFGMMVAGKKGGFVKRIDGSFFIDRDGTFFHHILDYLRDGQISDGILEDCGSQMQKEAEFYGLSSLNEQIHNYNHVRLNVGGKKFVVMREVLKQYPESIFGRMLSGQASTFKKRKDGSSYVERDGTNFHHILEYLRYGTISDDVIQECGVSLHDDAKFYMLPSLEKQIENYNNVKIDVGGREFVISRKVLTKFADSMFGMMVAGKKGGFVKRIDGSFFIDRDGTFFHHILDYLRDGQISDGILEDCGSQMQKEAEFYGLSSLNEQIHNYNHVRLNVGGKKFVVMREVLKQYPESIFGRMLSGQASTFKKRKDGSSYVERDGTNFHHILEYLRYGTISDDVIQECGVSLHDDAKFYMLPSLEKQIENYNNVKIDVGGREFVISRKVLTKFADSMFGMMVAGKKGGFVKRIDGSFFIDRDGTFFHHILDYLRDGQISDGILEDCGSQMQKEAEFYGLSSLNEQIHNYNHVRLNVGGKKFVVMREVLKQYPESIFGRMLSGQASTFKKRKDGSFYIERDGTNFHKILEYLRYGMVSDDVVKECGVSLHDDAKFYMLPGLEKRIENYHNVKVDVGGREFVITRKLLLAGEDDDYLKRSDGSYVVQHDGTNFDHILAYLRSGTLSADVLEKHTESLLADAEFYMLPGLKDRINNYDKVKLSISGSEFVVSRRVLNKFPDSLFGKMLAGEVGDYVRKDDGSYWIEHDASIFSHILDYLKGKTIPDNVIEMYHGPSLSRSDDVIMRHRGLRLDDAEFYMLPGLKNRIEEYHADMQMGRRRRGPRRVGAVGFATGRHWETSLQESR